MKEAFRGQGLMTEAVAEVVHFGYEKLELKGIVAYTGAENAPSMAVLGKSGFEKGHDRYRILCIEQLPPGPCDGPCRDSSGL